MTAAKERELVLPFSGFYDSLWSDMIDEQERQSIEYQPEREIENNVPEALRITEADDLTSVYFDNTDYAAAYRKIAERYVRAFNQAFKDETRFDLGLSFSELDSPREYNFGTDRIFAVIPETSVAYLHARLAEDDDDEALETIIKDRFTSRSGFASYYPDDIEDWRAKPLADYDHNELQTLLLAVMEQSGMDPDKVEREIYGEWPDSGYGEWSDAVNWGAVTAGENAIRESKSQSLTASISQTSKQGEVT